MHIQCHSDTNFRLLLTDLQESIGFYCDIDYDASENQIYVEELALDDPTFWDLIQEYNAELISN